VILVDGDPTINISDIRRVRTVLKGDRLYDSAALFQSMGVAPARRRPKVPKSFEELSTVTR
jgi:hypothetical protein